MSFILFINTFLMLKNDLSAGNPLMEGFSKVSADLIKKGIFQFLTLPTEGLPEGIWVKGDFKSGF